MRSFVALSIAAALCASCSASDRKDGALVIRISGAPSEVDTVDVTIRAGGRRFSSRFPRPSDDLITVFDAVPIGLASVDLVLLAGERPIATKLDLAIDIVEHETRELVALFSGGPMAVISGAVDRELHLVSEGMIELIVTAEDPALAVDVSVQANMQPVDVEPRGAGVFAAEIDPKLAGESLPAPIAVDIAICLSSDRAVCTTSTRSITVHRVMWSVNLGSVSKARPAFEGSVGVFGDRLGLVHFLDGQDGHELHPALQLAAPIITEVAIADDLAIVADGMGLAHAIELAAGTDAWTVDLGAAPEGGAVYDGRRVIIAAGKSVFAIEPLTRMSRMIAELPEPIQATPLADGRGVVVADKVGNVLALDMNDNVVFTASVSGGVRAPPIRDRDGAGVVIATEDGELVRFDRHGARNGAPISIDAPIIYRPVIAGTDLVVAAGVFVVFVDETGTQTLHRQSSPITGGPDVWSDRAVIVGLKSGALVVVARDGGKKQLARVDASALSPLVLDAPRRVLAGGSMGQVQMLVAEEGF